MGRDFSYKILLFPNPPKNRRIVGDVIYSKCPNGFAEVFKGYFCFIFWIDIRALLVVLPLK